MNYAQLYAFYFIIQVRAEAKLNNKDINLLQAICYLKVIEKYAGKKQAAQEFGVSIDTLNKYIDNLEQELGYKVLSSNVRGSFLTQRGQDLLQKSSILETMLDDIKSKAEDKKEISGEVRMAISSIAASAIFSKDLVSFQAQYPEIKLRHLIRNEDGQKTIPFSDVDIAISPILPKDSDVVIIFSKKIEFGFFAAPQYISKYGCPQNMDDLIEKHHIVNKIGYEKYIKGWEDILKKAKSNNFATNVSYYMYEVLKNGLGIGIMPLRFKREGMLYLEHLPCQSDISLHLITHQGSKNIPKNRAVLNYYKNLLQEL